MTARAEPRQLSVTAQAELVRTSWPGVIRAPSREALQWARGVMVETDPDLASDLDRVIVLRDGPKRLAMVESGDGRCSVLKQYADDRGAWTRRWLQRLAEAGLAPPAPYTVTPARGWSGIHHTLVTDLADGQPWSSWLLAPVAERDAAAFATAEWVLRLQSLHVALPDRTGYRAEQQLRRESSRLAAFSPAHAARLRQVVKAAHQRLYSEPAAVARGLVASHGDLHPNNLHVAAGTSLTVTAIDVDTAGLRRPAYDVGYALAQLMVVSWMQTSSLSTGAAAGLAFWRQWTVGDSRDADAVPAEIARALVQSLHFELITYRTGRADLLDRWLNVAEAVLTHGVPAALSALTSPQESAS